MCDEVCGVREACLQFALDNKLTIGVWGGQTGPDLVRLLDGVKDVHRV